MIPISGAQVFCGYMESSYQRPSVSFEGNGPSVVTILGVSLGISEVTDAKVSVGQ